MAMIVLRTSLTAVLVPIVVLIALNYFRTGSRPGVSSAATASPNILIIVTDDQRNGLTVMNDTTRWFGRGGTQYTNAYVTTPTCCPSRASILTGRYVHNHRVSNDEKATVLDPTTTINYYLNSAGYHTALFGKYLNSWPIDKPPPYWDEFAYFKNSNSDAYNGRGWNVDGTITNTDDYATHYIGERAEAVIRSSTAQPWLLYLATPNPHGPFVAEERYDKTNVGQFWSNPAIEETDLSDKPLYVQKSSFVNGDGVRRKQLQTLFSVDDMVQRVFATLQDTAQLDNTLAIFISDNGRLWGEHKRCCKSVPYLQSIQVPMFARWPDHFPSGRQDDRIVANIDIVPTVLKAAGVKAANAPLDGRSLLAAGSRTRLLTEFASSRSDAPTWASMLTSAHQYTEYATGKREYYDLVNDPWQLTNLLGDHNPDTNPPNVSKLSSQLARDRQCAGSSCP
jgi:arylsulfatase A-like enzyme